MATDRLPSSEITPENVYFNRRNLLKATTAAASVIATGLAYRFLNPTGSMAVSTDEIQGVSPVGQDGLSQGFDLEEARTSLEKVANYNNFYEFTTSKENVAAVSMGFESRPWQVSVDGMVHNPKIFDIDDIMKMGPLEDRIYRMRCVEAWSMVIPWVGLPLSRILNQVDPMGSAKYVAFQTLNDPGRMPGQKKAVMEWPYVEGLRLDEAMHPLTILAVGLYGRILPPQNGAPLRLVVPWKYGFKGIKSIVKITLLDSMPVTSWKRESPSEYGFYANVNPMVPHPRWSQATEQRVGEAGRRQTLMFNGYARQVADLYRGMDLRTNF